MRSYVYRILPRALRVGAGRVRFQRGLVGPKARFRWRRANERGIFTQLHTNDTAEVFFFSPNRDKTDALIHLRFGEYVVRPT